MVGDCLQKASFAVDMGADLFTKLVNYLLKCSGLLGRTCEEMVKLPSWRKLLSLQFRH